MLEHPRVVVCWHRLSARTCTTHHLAAAAAAAATLPKTLPATPAPALHVYRFAIDDRVPLPCLHARFARRGGLVQFANCGTCAESDNEPQPVSEPLQVAQVNSRGRRPAQRPARWGWTRIGSVRTQTQEGGGNYRTNTNKPKTKLRGDLGSSPLGHGI